ncbi:10462_t:CDS:2, partial [Entrophospora sp. SA101]
STFDSFWSVIEFKLGISSCSRVNTEINGAEGNGGVGGGALVVIASSSLFLSNKTSFSSKDAPALGLNWAL